MFIRLLILFIVVPLLELLVIVEIGSRIGYPVTILLLIVVSFSGAALAKREGYRAVELIQADVQAGRMPGDSLINGALILAGAILMITPGYITDAVGLLLLLPPVRKVARGYVKRRLRQAAAARTFRVWNGGPPPDGFGPDSDPNEPEQRRKELGD